MLDPDAIASRLSMARERICAAALRARRDPASVRLVLASKAQPPEAIRAAHHAGARDFGENYVQEAAAKRVELADLVGVVWHLIGHLQTNKARSAARTFDIIHTLDSPRLADALARARPAPPMPVLIEVNIADETTKSGVASNDIERLIEAARHKVSITGLMTIAPVARDPEDVRPYFARMRELRDRLVLSTGLALSELSMGMTDDFEVAIEEGATMVRIGRAVFGERSK